MRKIILGILLTAGCSAFAQVNDTTDSPNFQIGLQYNPLLGKNSFLTENYYFRKIVFIDASYNYLSFKNDDLGRENVNFINIGVGARF